ncbi:hypothetical protein EDD22DRAFT_949815 [Suillus occidentalis]|nr:hypothetical protein EDD22DRAFT_949815 [Suillus occidentalis]
MSCYPHAPSTTSQPESSTLTPQPQKTDSAVARITATVFKKAETCDADCVITSATTSSGACKRKLQDLDVDTQHESNIILQRPRLAGVKRIRREKTGTDWQSVLDIVKYSEERQGLAAAVKQREAAAAVLHEEIWKARACQ